MKVLKLLNIAVKRDVYFQFKEIVSLYLLENCVLFQCLLNGNH